MAVEFLRIFKRVLRVYFQNVQRWLRMEQVAQCLDFFIIEAAEESALGESFLHEVDQIDRRKLPLILEGECQGIL